MKEQYQNAGSWKDRQELVSARIAAIAAQFVGARPRVVDYGSDDQRVNGFDLEGEEGLYVSYDPYKNRFCISGKWPGSKTPNDGTCFTPSCLPSPSITVDAEKSDEQIARDITRRFLPAYREVLAKCIERRDAHDAYIRKVNGLAAELAEILGTSNGGRYHNDRDPVRRNVRLPDNVGYGEIEAGTDSATFTIRALPADKARKLAAFLKTL